MAAESLGIPWHGTENDADWPRGCYEATVGEDVVDEGAYFNKHTSGASDNSARPLCMQESEADQAAPAMAALSDMVIVCVVLATVRSTTRACAP